MKKMHLKLQGGKEKKNISSLFLYRRDYKKIGSVFFILRIIELASKLKSFFLV